MSNNDPSTSVEGVNTYTTERLPDHPRRIPRSIGALLAGFFTIVVLSVGTDMVLHTAGIYPPVGEGMSDSLYVLATVYRIVYGIVGCYIAARLAPSRPMLHATVLGGVGFVLSIVGAVVMWDAGPAWYSLAVIAISIPCAWIGGKLRESQLSAHTND
jgi:hypothetical protein